MSGNEAVAGARIGVFGGTFDPIHIGHLILAERARESLTLERVLFVPANVPPHKREATMIAAPQHRAEMLRLAIDDNDAFAVDAHELERDGVSYTVDTLRHLASRLSGASITLLIGADNARDFATWCEPRAIAELAMIGVWARPGSDLPPEILPGVAYQRIDSPLLEISSTDIRERVASGRSIRYLVPANVADYIERHGLYR